VLRYHPRDAAAAEALKRLR